MTTTIRSNISSCYFIPTAFVLLVLTSIALLPNHGFSQDQSEGDNTSGQDDSAAESHDYPANHLADETSPYLLMHSHNPVDWYPWGEEAIAKAKRENKPIFLSIGYAACHWCHVMERESFMNEEIAAILNEHFVCIKVDREERPDIDNIYMKSLFVYNQLSRNGRGGGWPLSMFLTPNAEPFFGGTYFPPNDRERGFSFGFKSLIETIHKNWNEAPEGINKDAATITRVTKAELAGQAPSESFELSHELITTAHRQLEKQFDATNGGFGFDPANDQAPKFPEPSNLIFLLELSSSSDSKISASAKRMLTTTLDLMAAGGIQDHLGGGFHRYSVDRYWRIPHFEKMAYDNGQLLSVYARAYELTGNEEYRWVAEGIADFMLRELRAPDGGFYSSLDADSEGEEGKFYRWEKAEVDKLLGELNSSEVAINRFKESFGLNDEPNFEEEYYALQRELPWARLAKEYDVTPSELRDSFATIRRALFDARAKRVRPPTDDKVLTAWNGLIITGLADAGRLLDRPDYTKAASEAADFIWENMRQEDGGLFRTYGDGKAKLNGYLVDYAMLIEGMLALYETTDDPKWLQRSDELMQIQLNRFWDEEQGGFFFVSTDHESLLARAKDPTDGAIPSGNSVSACNLLRLQSAFDELAEGEKRDYRDAATRTMRSVAFLLERSPAAVPRLVTAITQVVDKEKPTTQEQTDDK